jgi:branched-chain amino acid transport system ATP-binding protein
VSDVFDEFERLAERSNQRAGELRGGERQMLVIAMAMVGNPKLVLLDEPVEGVAPYIVNPIVDIVRQVREADITVLLVEQNVEVVPDPIDRGYLLYKGEIQMAGSAAELADATEEIEYYLNVRVCPFRQIHRRARPPPNRAGPGATPVPDGFMSAR